MAATPGYSGTPLARKLGIAAGSCIAVIDAPPEYADWVDPLPERAQVVAWPDLRAAIVHLFVVDRAVLAAHLAEFRANLGPEVAIWVSWPKKASKQPTTVTEDVIRELALPLGLVDIKVCAVSAVWSGLKLVVRRELR
jgi:hypothetical protein